MVPKSTKSDPQIQHTESTKSESLEFSGGVLSSVSLSKSVTKANRAPGGLLAALHAEEAGFRLQRMSSAMLTSCEQANDMLICLERAEGVEIPKQSSMLVERPPLAGKLVRGALDALNDDDYERVRSNVASLFSTGHIRVGGVYSGTDFAWPLFNEFLHLASGCVVPSTDVVMHTMAVEWCGWKRQFIVDNHPNLQYLFGDASLLKRGHAHCYIHEKEVPEKRQQKKTTPKRKKRCRCPNATF